MTRATLTALFAWFFGCGYLLAVWVLPIDFNRATDFLGRTLEPAPAALRWFFYIFARHDGFWAGPWYSVMDALILGATTLAAWSFCELSSARRKL